MLTNFDYSGGVDIYATQKQKKTGGRSPSVHRLRIPTPQSRRNTMGFEFLIVNNNAKGEPVVNKDGQLSVTPFKFLDPKRKALAKAKFINRCTFLGTWKAYILRKCIVILDLEQHDRSVERAQTIAYAGERYIKQSHPTYRFQHIRPTWTFRGLHLYAPGFIVPRMLRLAGILTEARRITFNKFYGGRIDQVVNCGMPFPRKLRIKLVDKDTFTDFDFNRAEGIALFSNKTWHRFGLKGRVIKAGLASKNLLFRHDLPRKYRVDIIADRKEFDKLGLWSKNGTYLTDKIRHRPSCHPSVVAGKTDLKMGWDQMAYNNVRVSFENTRNNDDYFDHLELDAISKSGMFDDIEMVEKFFGYPDGDQKKICTKYMLAHHLGKLGIPALFHPEIKTDALTTIWNSNKRLLLKSISGQYRTIVPKHMLTGPEIEIIGQVAPHIELFKTDVIIDGDLVGVDWELIQAIHKDFDGDAIMIYFETAIFNNISTLEEVVLKMHDESKEEHPGRRTAFWKVVENKCGAGGGHNMRIAAMATGHIMKKSKLWFKKMARWCRVELETGVNSKKDTSGKKRLGWKGILYNWMLNKKIADREREASNAVRGNSILAAVIAGKELKPTTDAGPFENALFHLSKLNVNYRTNKFHFEQMIQSEQNKFTMKGINLDKWDKIRRKTFVLTMNHRIERLKTVAGHLFEDPDKARAWMESQKTLFDELDMIYRWELIKAEINMAKRRNFHAFMILLYYKNDKSTMAWLHNRYRETVKS
jgi:hypothetical protein